MSTLSTLEANSLKGALEALLLVSSDPVSAPALAGALDIAPGECASLLAELKVEYEEANRGFQLREVAGGWRLFTHPAYHDVVEAYVLSWDTQKLSQAALETLAVIAYHQPVTREVVKGIRGVNSDGVIASLVDKGLVRELGRDPQRGQAIIYGTTNAFLEKFGLRSTRDLPDLEQFAPDEQSRQFIRERLSGRSTGATFIVPIIFLLFMRSKQLKAVGKASVVPVMFAVNEPLLFAAPIILNPYFLIPFLFAPVANVLIGKFFIDFLGMNGFIYAMPWALPGPIGTFIDTNFQPISLVLVVVLLVVDFLIYYPFCKAYDNVLCKQEAETLAEEEAEETKAVKTAAAPAVEAPVVETASATEASAAPSALKGKDLRVLVLCAGAGTSALLANALKEGADELGIDITANAGAYGSHYAIMDQYNVIVLAPQVRTYYNEMKADTDRLGITLLSPKGKQYIDLTKDPKGAVAWIEENLEA